MLKLYLLYNMVFRITRKNRNILKNGGTRKKSAKTTRSHMGPLNIKTLTPYTKDQLEKLDRHVYQSPNFIEQQQEKIDNIRQIKRPVGCTFNFSLNKWKIEQRNGNCLEILASGNREFIYIEEHEWKKALKICKTRGEFERERDRRNQPYEE